MSKETRAEPATVEYVKRLHEESLLTRTDNEYVRSLRLMAKTLIKSIDGFIEVDHLEEAHKALVVLQDVAKNIKEFQGVV